MRYRGLEVQIAVLRDEIMDLDREEMDVLRLLLEHYTQSSVLRNVNLRNQWWGGARKRINQKGSEPGNAIISGDFP